MLTYILIKNPVYDYDEASEFIYMVSNDIKDILDNLERDGILKKDGEFYLYSPFGYI